MKMLFQASCRLLVCCLPGLVLATGCSSTSPFASTTQKPVPIAAQLANNPYATPNQTAPNRPSPLAAGGQQFTQTGPNTYTQTPPTSSNPFLAGIRSATETIGNAFTIEPTVIPASSPTSLANQPTDIGADLHFQAAQVYEGQQNISGAISHYQKALEKSPSDPKILVGFGRLYDRQGELKRAEGLYQQALQVDPNNCAALNAVGICYAKQGNLELALAQLQRASQLQPQNPRYKNNIANVLADAGRLDEAYAQLVSVHGEAGAHYNLGYLLLQQNKPDLARRELGLALQANPYLEQAQKLLSTIDTRAIAGAPAAPARPVSSTGPIPAQYSVSPSQNLPAGAANAGPQSGPSRFDPSTVSTPQNLPPL